MMQWPNWNQFVALLRLRWQLTYNASRKTGSINGMLTILLLFIVLVIATLGFFVAFVAGAAWFEDASADTLMYVWDGLVLAFLAFVVVSLVTEIQQSELITLDKMLHLPVSLQGAFLLNYASSWLSLSVLMFLPVMLGLSLSLVWLHGLWALLNLPTTVAFFAMVTALTYQLRGWLERLMTNRRRRGTVAAIMTTTLILAAQIPNAVNLFVGPSIRGDAMREEIDQYERDREMLTQQMGAGQITPQEFQQQSDKLELTWSAISSNTTRQTVAIFVYANTWIPLGWPAIVVRSLAMHRPWPALLAMTGMVGISAGSLWTAYRSTMRSQTQGQSHGGATSKSKPIVRIHRDQIGQHIQGLTPHVATIVRSSLRNFLRTPQAKIAMVMPVIMTLAVGSVVISGALENVPSNLRSFSGVGLLGVILFCVTQFVTNIFGLERNGFRAWILMPVSRRDILLGRNLAMFPLVLVQFLLMLIALQWFAPMPLLHLLATVLQLPTAYFLLALAGNFFSIVTPYAISASGMNAANAKVVPVLMQVFLMLVSPLLLVPAVMALGAEILLAYYGPGLAWLPVYCLVSVVELAAVLWLYHQVLTAQGRLLFRRETLVMAEVASAAE